MPSGPWTVPPPTSGFVDDRGFWALHIWTLNTKYRVSYMNWITLHSNTHIYWSRTIILVYWFTISFGLLASMFYTFKGRMVRRLSTSPPHIPSNPSSFQPMPHHAPSVSDASMHRGRHPSHLWHRQLIQGDRSTGLSAFGLFGFVWIVYVIVSNIVSNGFYMFLLVWWWWLRGVVHAKCTPPVDAFCSNRYCNSKSVCNK